MCKTVILLLFLIFSANSFDFKNGISRQWPSLIRNTNNQKSLNNKQYEVKKFLGKIKIKKNPYEENYFREAKIDNFSFDNYDNFDLRYLVDKRFFVNSTLTPILFYCGHDASIDLFYPNIGYVTEILAEKFNAIVILAEHRFFGKSMPFKKFDKDIYKNKFLSSEQALMDYVNLIDHIRNKYGLLKNPVIAVGGSYGGMLSAWARMKFPHIFAGAIASSAPILMFGENINNTDFFKITTETYLKESRQCPALIKEGFEALKVIRTKQYKWNNPDILKNINSLYNICNPISLSNNTVMDLDKLESTLEDAVVSLAQYNYPYESNFVNPLPPNPVKYVCDKIIQYQQNNAPISGLMEGSISMTFNKFNLMDIKTKNSLSYLKIISDVYFNYTGSLQCLNIGNSNDENKTINPWEFMACSEMIMPFGKTGKTDMFNEKKWDINEYIKKCQEEWDVDPRPNWILNYYGGMNFTKESNNFQNIFFVNGDMDPYSAGCPKNSTNSKVNVFTAQSAHHLDLRLPNEKDPISIKKARKIMEVLVMGWINEWRLK